MAEAQALVARLLSEGRIGTPRLAYAEMEDGPVFRDNWRGAARAGVPRGAYHFFYHCRPAAEQAAFFIRTVPRSAGATPELGDLVNPPRCSS